MTIAEFDLIADAALAANIATSAGELLLELRQDPTFRDPDDLRDEADRRAHNHIMALLGRHFPDDAILSEEGVDEKSRLRAARTWIIDPLDGTNEYGFPERGDWAVHVALVINHVAVLGAVAIPSLGVTYASGTVTPPFFSDTDQLKIAVSRSRRSTVAARIADSLGAEVVRMGSAGAKAMAVVRGDVDIYAHSGGMYEWDSAAPVAVAAAAGLHVSRIDGSPLLYNQDDPWLPDLLICRRDVAADVLEAVNG